MKHFMKLVLVSLFVILLSGCSHYKSNVYMASTDEKVKITIKTNGGYDISEDTPFIISKEGNSLSQGTFMFSEYYDDYIDVISKADDTEILMSDKKDNIEYILFSNNGEYNYVIRINNSKTGILLINNHSLKEAKLCFELLKFTLER